jgi:YVTN family beta-propeller protein
MGIDLPTNTLFLNGAYDISSFYHHISAIQGKTMKLIASKGIAELNGEKINELAPTVSSGSNDSYRIYALDSLGTFDVIDFPKDHANSSNVVVTAKVPVSRYLSIYSAIAVNSNTNIAYVTQPNADTVSVIDLYTNKILSNITVGNFPYGIAVNSNKNIVYVANSGSDTVSVIDGSHNKVTANIQVGKNPRAIAVNPKTNNVYVADHDDNKISVINGSFCIRVCYFIFYLVQHYFAPIIFI